MSVVRDTFTTEYCRLCGRWIEGSFCSYDCDNDGRVTEERPPGTVGVATYKLVEDK